MLAAARPRRAPYAWLAPGVLLGALSPLALLGLAALRGTLGTNPIADALNQSGLYALIFLLASLAATPLKAMFGLSWPLRIRRLLGLLAFFYASLHVLTYVLLDRGGKLWTLLVDLLERPFITVGFLAFVLLVPLAITSTKRMIKRLGAKRWRRLHRLSYLAGFLGVVHFVWGAKKDISEPLLYGFVLLGLLGVRVAVTVRKQTRESAE